MKPICEMLRLCNRYGKGEGVLVNKIPIEIISMIEECLHAPLREHMLQHWEHKQAYYEGNFRVRDYVGRGDDNYWEARTLACESQ